MADTQRVLDRMERVATLMDSGFELPVVGVKVGLDPLLGLVPGGGDLAAAVVSLYLVVEAARLGVSVRTLARMVFNVALDAVVGTVPLLGDAFDLVWRANDRNVRLAKRDLGVE
ncbi:DUF4112 domain-containing protein [Halosegnis marinus]|uniref:DUF4112 domain-containing protein n=1 Tax=Halosegnis marinus TaxID=3034023 RepID=A0ABD5ZMI3_9EURY|nr:DUF4112 domain-containing protein [Halosegnis sp. DT85]